jgi:hypothetical protein
MGAGSLYLSNAQLKSRKGGEGGSFGQGLYVLHKVGCEIGTAGLLGPEEMLHVICSVC